MPKRQIKIDIGDARYQLHFGPYRIPRFRIGQKVQDEVRGEVTIVGVSSGRIPWPIGKSYRHKSFVVFRGLAKAVRKESPTAICYWWGLTPQTVTKWRNALGLTEKSEGSLKLQLAYCTHEDWAAILERLHSKAQDPVRREKIAASRRGKKRPPHVIEAMRQAALKRRRKGKT